MLTLIAKAYSKPNEYVGYNSMPDLDVSNGADFYQAMESKRKTYSMLHLLIYPTSKKIIGEIWQAI